MTDAGELSLSVHRTVGDHRRVRRGLEFLSVPAMGWGAPGLRATDREQALLVLAHLRKGETYPDRAAGFDIGASTAYR